MEEKKGLEQLEAGQIIKVYFKEGFHRPTNGQRFRFMGLQGDPKNMEKKDGFYVDGFVVIAQPIDLDGMEIVEVGTQGIEKGQVLPQALFPHTIQKIEADLSNINPKRERRR